jgi:hypothetical protein
MVKTGVEVAHALEPRDRRREIRRRALDRHQHRVDPVPLERGIERLRRAHLGDRVAEDDEEPRGAGDHLRNSGEICRGSHSTTSGHTMMSASTRASG